MHRPALSIVIPCYNEEGCLETLHARVGAAARAAVGGDYEIVLVNDGSRDASWPAMQPLAAGDPHLVAITLSRNTRHQPDPTAGLALGSGEPILNTAPDQQATPAPPHAAGATHAR